MANSPRGVCRRCTSTSNVRPVDRVIAPGRNSSRSGWLCAECIAKLVDDLDTGAAAYPPDRWDERSLRGLPRVDPAAARTDRVGDLNAVYRGVPRHNTVGPCKRCGARTWSRLFTNLAPRSRPRWRVKKRNRTRLCRACVVHWVTMDGLGLPVLGLDPVELSEALLAWPDHGARYQGS